MLDSKTDSAALNGKVSINRSGGIRVQRTAVQRRASVGPRRSREQLPARAGGSAGAAALATRDRRTAIQQA